MPVLEEKLRQHFLFCVFILNRVTIFRIKDFQMLIQTLNRLPFNALGPLR